VGQWTGYSAGFSLGTNSLVCRKVTASGTTKRASRWRENASSKPGHGKGPPGERDESTRIRVKKEKKNLTTYYGTTNANVCWRKIRDERFISNKKGRGGGDRKKEGVDTMDFD